MGREEPASEAASRTVGRKVRQAPFGAPHVFVLAVVDGDNTCAVHRLVRSETVIGRGEGAQFLIHDDQISKAHCKIRVEGSVCTIVDLGSRNGTLVNGRPLARDVALRLRHLDEVEIGGHRLFLLAGRYRDTPRNNAV